MEKGAVLLRKRKSGNVKGVLRAKVREARANQDRRRQATRGRDGPGHEKNKESKAYGKHNPEPVIHPIPPRPLIHPSIHCFRPMFVRVTILSDEVGRQVGIHTVPLDQQADQFIRANIHDCTLVSSAIDAHCQHEGRSQTRSWR
jgi:hypothetical protein